VKPSILLTVFFGAMSAALLTALLLWRDAFGFWQMFAMSVAAAALAVLALTNEEP
jgi:hypothetical protein